MSEPETEYTTPWIRHALLWAGFTVLVMIGIWTVVLPSVEDSAVDPDVTTEGEMDEDGTGSDENTNDSNN